MKLKDLKEWVNSLPEAFLEYDVMNSEEGKLETPDRAQVLAGITEADDNGEYTYRLDRPVIKFMVDETTSEILIINAENK